MPYNAAVNEAEYKPEFKLTKHAPYLTLMGELWDVYCEDFRKNWLGDKWTAL